MYIYCRYCEGALSTSPALWGLPFQYCIFLLSFCSSKALLVVFLLYCSDDVIPAHFLLIEIVIHLN